MSAPTLRDAKIVLISSIDWDFVWQAHQEVATRLAAAGNDVVFVENSGGVRPLRAGDARRLLARARNISRALVEGARHPAPRITVVPPMLAPFGGSPIATLANERFLLPKLAADIRRTTGPSPVLYTFLPTANTLRLIGLLGGERIVVAYHSVADYAALAGRGTQMTEAELALLRRADLVFVQSRVLEQRFSRLNDRVTDLGIGADLGIFDPARVSVEASEVAALPRPVIGYVGGIHQHIDFDLLRAVATAFPEGSLVLAGPLLVERGIVPDRPNVHVLPQRPHADVPSLVSAFDVGLIPYARSAYTESVNPTKLFEYLAMGVPVVSTDLPEVVRHGLPTYAARVAETPTAFVDALHAALLEPRTQSPERRAIALQHDWSVVVGRIGRAIAERLATRAPTLS